MKLRSLIENYIIHKRSLGMRYESGARHLRQFEAFVGDKDIRSITPEHVRAFLGSKKTSTWHGKFNTLNLFYRFAIGRQFVTQSPLPTTKPKRNHEFEAYIYSPEDLRKILIAVDQTQNIRHRLTADSMKILLILLFHTGLRISEALALRIQDVDLENNVLVVWDSKFFKSRLVPISSPLSRLLQDWFGRERKALLPAWSDASSPFFIRRDQKRPDSHSIAWRFRQIRARASIHGRADSSYAPRIHDIRHTFAVYRLLSWYKEGVDVQRALPYLSTYLGHVNISCTQQYLSMIPALLKEANRRFERYFLTGVRYA